MNRAKLEAVVLDAIRLGISGAESVERLAMLDALAGKHCAHYVPPLRFNPDGSNNSAYDAAYFGARAILDAP